MWPSETARLWPVKEKQILATSKDKKKDICLPKSETSYLLSHFPGLNKARYKLQPVDFWHHRSLHHSGQRPTGNEQMYGYCDWYLQFHTHLDLEQKKQKHLVLVAEITWRLKLSLSSAKANIGTSKRLKWEGYWTLSSAQTGWEITWYGSTGFTHLKGKKKQFKLNLVYF